MADLQYIKLTVPHLWIGFLREKGEVIPARTIGVACAATLIELGQAEPATVDEWRRDNERRSLARRGLELPQPEILKGDKP